MSKKTSSVLLSMLVCICMLVSLPLTSCGKDDEPSSSTSIEGTWICDSSDDSFTDIYTLIFNKDGSGSISNTYGTRATYQMNFDWSLTMASNGSYRLSVIYTSGDRNVDGPFSGGYAQYNRTVTIAGRTLSIAMDDNTVMLFQRK